METHYTKRVSSGTWTGWALVKRWEPYVVLLASTREEVEKLSRAYVREIKGYLRLRNSKGHYYDNVDYREEDC